MISKSAIERLTRQMEQGRSLLLAHKDGRFLQEGSSIKHPLWGDLDGAMTFDSFMAHANANMLWPEIGFFPEKVTIQSVLNKPATQAMNK